MKSRQLMKAGVVVMVAAAPALLFALINGPDARHTAAPGDDPLACSTAGCHTSSPSGGPINPQGGDVMATFSSGATYTPGEPVTVTVEVNDPSNTRAGFQMTARLESDLAQAQAGHFAAGAGSFVLCDNNVARQGANCPASFPVEFIEHFQPSSDPWTFTWTPPAEAAGPVHFYVAGNAVNGNMLSDAGDHVYTNEFVLAPADVCTDEAPSIGGVISAGGFGANPNIASGTWVEIFGQNFAVDTAEWAGSDFQNGIAPTELNRVKVSIHGRDAFVRFISPGQVNVFSPDDDATGPVEIRLSNCDRPSEPIVVEQEALVPGMLQFTGESANYLYAFRGAEPRGIPGAPVEPGEVVVLYGIGFGGTNPAIGPGAIVTQANRVTNPLSIRIGEVELDDGDILYAGLAPNFVGLYQFNIRVPEVPDGDAPVAMSIGGVELNQELVLQVQR